MTSIASISRSFLLLMALSSVACSKKGEVEQNYTIVKTEVDEVQRIAGTLLAESNRLLDEEFSGDPKERSAWEEARERREWEHVLFLPHLTTLNGTQAKAISENASWVYLNGLTDLTPEVAQKLFSEGYTQLSLNGLKEIPPEIASHMDNLSRRVLPQNYLLLNGLKELTPEVAKALMGQGRSAYIHLEGVTVLSDEVLQIISRVPADVRERFVRFSMPNLQLTTELAKKIPEETLSSVISKKSVLSENMVEIISQSGLEHIYLDNLKGIQPAQLSSILRRERTSISMDGITKLKKGMVRELALVSPRYVSLNGLESLSDEDIDILAKSNIMELSVRGLNQKEYKKLDRAFRKADKYVSFKRE